MGLRIEHWHIIIDDNDCSRSKGGSEGIGILYANRPAPLLALCIKQERTALSLSRRVVVIKLRRYAVLLGKKLGQGTNRELFERSRRSSFQNHAGGIRIHR